MKANIWFLALIALSIAVVNGAELYSGCGAEDGWIPYRDEKCVKLFPNFVTRNQAEIMCNEQPSDLSIPTLVAIRSAAEQQFLVEYISKTSEFNNIWIGAERRLDSANEFVWSDGTSVERYTNWGEGFPTTDVRRTCVQLRSELTRGVHDMVWNDVPCMGVANWFVCEKVQAWSMKEAQQALLEARREILNAEKQLTHMRDVQLVDLRNELANVDNSVPIGFIYTQLHNQPTPAAIWSNTTWEDITHQYAGLFFRAAGGEAAPFGTIQVASFPRITTIRRGERSGLFSVLDIPTNGAESAFISSGATPSASQHWGLSFRVNPVENRPRNTAMRIWRRTR